MFSSAVLGYYQTFLVQVICKGSVCHQKTHVARNMVVEVTYQFFKHVGNNKLMNKYDRVSHTLYHIIYSPNICIIQLKRQQTSAESRSAANYSKVQRDKKAIYTLFQVFISIFCFVSHSYFGSDWLQISIANQQNNSKTSQQTHIAS